MMFVSARFTSGLVLLATSGCHVLAAQKSQESAKASGSQVASTMQYSENAICRQHNCVNPVFPGLLDLAQLGALTWQCQSISDVSQFLNFCANAVNYNVAVPSPNSSAVALQTLVEAQEQAAVTTFFYHLAGLNYEAWDYKDPSVFSNKGTDPCIVATQQMVCSTYFPKAEAGCSTGQQTSYLRPCSSTCVDYVNACNVQCCDESVQCVFEEPLILMDGTSVASGYLNAQAPSASCTGGTSLLQQSASPRGASPGWRVASLLALPFMTSGIFPQVPSSRALALSVVLLSASVSLQGCDLVIFTHETKNWEDKTSYITQFLYIPPGKPVSSGVLNSCDVAGLTEKERCNGNGICQTWNKTSTYGLVSLQPTQSFCLCDSGWADPECRTRRKSQATAFLLSIFAGYIGLDHFYLGEYFSGFAKMSTCGGLGLWWIYDVVRIGSGPVYTENYRLAQDLPHVVFVFLTVCFAAFLGWLAFGVLAAMAKRRQRMKKLLMQAEDEYMRTGSATFDINPLDDFGVPTKQSVRVPRQVTVGHMQGVYGSMASRAPPSPVLQQRAAPVAAAGAPVFSGHATTLGIQPQAMPYPSVAVAAPVPTPPFNSSQSIASLAALAQQPLSSSTLAPESTRTIGAFPGEATAAAAATLPLGSTVRL